MCRYYLSEPDREPQIPPCMSGHTCNFDLTERLACPFWAGGTYKSEEKDVRCRVPATWCGIVMHLPAVVTASLFRRHWLSSAIM